MEDRNKYMREYYAKNRTKIRKYVRDRARVRASLDRRKAVREGYSLYIFSVLGDRCVMCGFSDKRALQMDHINGRNGGPKSGNVDKRYKFVRENEEEAKRVYQILCANCNFIKRVERQEYFSENHKRFYP